MTSPKSISVAKFVGVLAALTALTISTGCSLLIGPDPSHLKDARAMEIAGTPSRMAPDIVTPEPFPEVIEPSPDVTSPEPAPDAVEPDVTEPDTAEPDSNEPELDPDVAEPETPEPEPADTDGDGVMDFEDCDKFDAENRWIISEDYSAEEIAEWSVPDGIEVHHTAAGAEFIWEELSSNRDLPFHIAPDRTLFEGRHFSMRAMATIEILEHHSEVDSFAAVAFHRGADSLRNCGLESNNTHALGRSEPGERPRTQYSSRIDDVVGAFSVDVSVTTAWLTPTSGEQDLHCNAVYNDVQTSELRFAPEVLRGDTSLLIRAKRVVVKSFRVCTENEN